MLKLESSDKMYSIRELYRIGRGPSSSHTMGPSYACQRAMDETPAADGYEVTLLGSLAKTGRGHRTDYAIRQTFGKIPVKIIFDGETKELPHPNTMRIKAFSEGNVIYDKMFLSVGGGAMRAVDAVSLAEMLYEDRKISLDLVIKTMYETGKDLSCRYRETSEGGLASLYGSDL